MTELDPALRAGNRRPLADYAATHFRWTCADGNRATVKKANPGKTIRLSWEDPDLTLATPVEFKFAPAGAKTTVMVTIDRLQTRAEADGYRRAWGEALDRMKSVVEA